VWEAAGARLIEVPSRGDGLDLAAALGALAEAGLTRVFCEGGGRIAASLLRAGLVDEVLGFTAGLALGSEGQPGLGPMRLDALSEAPRLRLVESRPVGGDVLHRWRVG
jgi:diaminohydroxyphosphoribosylaminopyrimidine deaminase/5-amino-6-(5-phosphoribosylamino)uracil reductase